MQFFFIFIILSCLDKIEKTDIWQITYAKNQNLVCFVNEWIINLYKY